MSFIIVEIQTISDQIIP